MDRKQFNISVKQAGPEVRTFCISTADEDREADILEPRGMVSTSYLKNPVVLFAHDYYRPPVGKTTGLRANDLNIEADVEFAPTDFGREIKTLVDAGFLRAASVGFDPLVPGEPLPNGRGYRYRKWELLEWSIVPVPANPNALIVAAQQRGLRVPAFTKMFSGQSPCIELADGTHIHRDYLLALIASGKATVLLEDEGEEPQEASTERSAPADPYQPRYVIRIT